MKSSDIQIAALVPIGPLNRFSYQYNSKLVLENLCLSFDKVYVISSSRENKRLPVDSDKISFISDSSSWFEIGDDNKELFSFEKLNENLISVAGQAKHSGYEFGLHIHINQYIDEKNCLRLKDYCRTIYEGDKAFGYVYKAYQIRDKITYPDTRLPWLINLKHLSGVRFDCDSIHLGGEHVKIASGLYSDAPYYITDIFGEMTEKDFYERYEYYLRHVGAAGEKGADWNYWRKYYQDKANKKIFNSSAELSEYGVKAFENIPGNALVNQIVLEGFDFLKLFKRKTLNLLMNKGLE